MAVGSRGDVTGLLLDLSQGRTQAREQLIPLVYDQLRGMARRSLKSERNDHTLQPTALVHEVYEKLIDQGRVDWQNRAHFFAVAAGLMRRILVDHARKHHALKRGGGATRVPLSEDVAGANPDVDVIALDAALGTLAERDPEMARIVELRYFSGLTIGETAEAVGMSEATVKREWAVARAWLRRRLTTGESSK